MISSTWATGGRDPTDAPNMALVFLWADLRGGEGPADLRGNPPVATRVVTAASGCRCRPVAAGGGLPGRVWHRVALEACWSGGCGNACSNRCDPICRADFLVGFTATAAPEIGRGARCDGRGAASTPLDRVRCIALWRSAASRNLGR